MNTFVCPTVSYAGGGLTIPFHRLMMTIMIIRIPFHCPDIPLVQSCLGNFTTKVTKLVENWLMNCWANVCLFRVWGRFFGVIFGSWRNHKFVLSSYNYVKWKFTERGTSGDSERGRNWWVRGAAGGGCGENKRWDCFMASTLLKKMSSTLRIPRREWMRRNLFICQRWHSAKGFAGRTNHQPARQSVCQEPRTEPVDCNYSTDAVALQLWRMFMATGWSSVMSAKKNLF